MSERTYSVADIMRKFIGPIEPTGGHVVDMVRLKNLETLLDVMDTFTNDIIRLKQYKHTHQYSMKKIGEKADEYLSETLDALKFECEEGGA